MRAPDSMPKRRGTNTSYSGSTSIAGFAIESRDRRAAHTSTKGNPLRPSPTQLESGLLRCTASPRACARHPRSACCRSVVRTASRYRLESCCDSARSAGQSSSHIRTSPRQLVASSGRERGWPSDTLHGPDNHLLRWRARTTRESCGSRAGMRTTCVGCSLEGRCGWGDRGRLEGLGSYAASQRCRVRSPGLRMYSRFVRFRPDAE